MTDDRSDKNLLASWRKEYTHLVVNRPKSSITQTSKESCGKYIAARLGQLEFF